MFAVLISFSAIYSGLVSVESYNLHKRAQRKTGRSAGEWWKEWWGKYILEVKDPTIQVVVCCRPQVTYPPPVRPPQGTNEFPQPPISASRPGTVATQQIQFTVHSPQNENAPKQPEPPPPTLSRNHYVQGYQSHHEKSVGQNPGRSHLSQLPKERYQPLNRHPPAQGSYKNIRSPQPHPTPEALVQPQFQKIFNVQPNVAAHRSRNTQPNSNRDFPEVIPHQRNPSNNNFQQNSQKSIFSSSLGSGNRPHFLQSGPNSNGGKGGESGMWRPNVPPTRTPTERHLDPHGKKRPAVISNSGNKPNFDHSQSPVTKSSGHKQHQNSNAPSSYPKPQQSNALSGAKSIHSNNQQFQPPNPVNSNFPQSLAHANVPSNAYPINPGVQESSKVQPFMNSDQGRLNQHSRNNDHSNRQQFATGRPKNAGRNDQLKLPLPGSAHNDDRGRFNQWALSTQRPPNEGVVPNSYSHTEQKREEVQKSISSTNQQPPIQQTVQSLRFHTHVQEENCRHFQHNGGQHQRNYQVHLHTVDMPDTIPHTRLLGSSPNVKSTDPQTDLLEQRPPNNLRHLESGQKTRPPQKSIYYKPPVLNPSRPPLLDSSPGLPYSGVSPVPEFPPPLNERHQGGFISQQHHNVSVVQTQPYEVTENSYPSAHFSPPTQSPSSDFLPKEDSTLIPSTEAVFVTYPPPVKPPTLLTERVVPTDGSRADCVTDSPPKVIPRPDSPLADGSMPPCAVEGKGFCLLTNDYPNDFVNEAVDSSINKVKVMYEELQTVGDPRLFESHHVGNSSAAKGEFVCQTLVEYERPGWVKDAISQEWMLVINTDVFPQKIRTESCKFPNQQCSYIAPVYQSSCQQRFSLHRLLALDPNDRKKSPVVTLLKFPAGCSCRVDPVRRDNYVKDYD